MLNIHLKKVTQWMTNLLNLKFSIFNQLHVHTSLLRRIALFYLVQENYTREKLVQESMNMQVSGISDGPYALHHDKTYLELISARTSLIKFEILFLPILLALLLLQLA